MISQPACAMRVLGYPLALLAVFMMVGGHWGVLQTVAWAGMLRDYTKAYGLAEGVEKTFSGDLPCKMCLKVEHGKKREEQKIPLVKIEKKAEALIDSPSLHFTRLFLPSETWPRPVSSFMPSHRDAPLSPPPQSIS